MAIRSAMARVDPKTVAYATRTFIFWIVGLVDSVEMLTLNPTGLEKIASVMGLDAGWAVIIQ